MIGDDTAHALALSVVGQLCANVEGVGSRVVHPAARDQIAAILAGAVRANVLPSPGPASIELYRAVAELTTNGMVKLDGILSADQIADIRRHVAPRPVYDKWIAALSDSGPRPLEEASRHARFGSYDQGTILSAPHLLELAFNPWVQGVAERYLGCPPTLTSLNMWWSFAGHPGSHVGNSQDFHRDIDTYRSCVFFVYLTDVTASTGPQCYIQRSHSLEAVASVFAERDIRMMRSEVAAKSHYAGGDLGAAFRADVPPSGDDRRLEPMDLFLMAFHGYGAGALYAEVFRGLFATVTGPAGTGFVTDTYGLHAGLPPTEQPRLCAWIRFSVDASYPASIDEALAAQVFERRIPDTPRNRFVIRQVLERRTG